MRSLKQLFRSAAYLLFCAICLYFLAHLVIPDTAHECDHALEDVGATPQHTVMHGDEVITISGDGTTYIGIEGSGYRIRSGGGNVQIHSIGKDTHIDALCASSVTIINGEVSIIREGNCGD